VKGPSAKSWKKGEQKGRDMHKGGKKVGLTGVGDIKRPPLGGGGHKKRDKKKKKDKKKSEGGNSAGKGRKSWSRKTSAERGKKEQNVRDAVGEIDPFGGKREDNQEEVSPSPEGGKKKGPRVRYGGCGAQKKDPGKRERNQRGGKEKKNPALPAPKELGGGPATACTVWGKKGKKKNWKKKTGYSGRERGTSCAQTLQISLEGGEGKNPISWNKKREGNNLKNGGRPTPEWGGERKKGKKGLSVFVGGRRNLHSWKKLLKKVTGGGGGGKGDFDS